METKYIIMFKKKSDKTFRVKEVTKKELPKVVKNYDIVFIQPNLFEDYVVPSEYIFS